MKRDNLVLTDIPESFSKEKTNIPLGIWCGNPFEDHSIDKKLNLDHWYNKRKKKRDILYLTKLNEKIIKFLYKSLNSIHNTNYSEKYWRILIGPFLFWTLPSIFDRWENIRFFFKKNKKKYSLISYNKINFEEPLTTLQMVNLFCNDNYLNHKIFSKIIFSNYSKRVLYSKKKLKTSNNITKYLDNFSWKTNSTNFVTSKFKKNSFFFKILLNFNKYLFDRKIFSTRKFFSLNLKLRNLPFSTEDFFKNLYFKFLDKIQNNRIEEKNLIRKKLLLRKKGFSRDKFENFLLDFILHNLPKIYVEYFSNAKNEIDNLLTKKKKIIFSQYDILFNDLYKIWVAEMTRLNSKLIISDHGAYDPAIVPTNLFHETKVSNKNFISHKFGIKKNQILISSSLPLLYRNFKKKRNGDKIILIHREVSRHTNKVMSMISATNVIEFLYLKKILKSLPKCIHDKARYKCINSYGLNLNREFSKNFGKNKIISDKQNYLKSLENAKIIVTLYLSTPTLESLKLNVPTLILLPKNFLLYEKRFDKILYNLKKNKIIFDNPEKMSKHIGKIWNNVDDWWLSKNVQKSKDLYLNNFLYFKANNEVEREYIKKLKDI